MLENLEIQNYRLFQNLKIEDFARVNLIVGKNNVGKSTLLEAISLLVAQYQQNELWQSFLKIANARGEKTDRRIYQLRHFFSNHEFTAANPVYLQ